ncbi:hypothetical protein AB0K05_02850 [Nonomuraea sp. NPDC049486]|uniref:hypothetical protein n=1 Tax=Nonomuraea sp. NPDC049486 TaxID=3155773 RepID=UPI00341F681B
MLRRALAQLTRKQRAVIVLRFWEDLTEAAVTALAATTAGAVAVWPHPAGIVATQGQDVPDLRGKVGAIRYAYQTPCEIDEMTRRSDCSAVEWRVVTQKGTYRLPQALTSSKKAPRVPVAISRDGRRLAYYSRDAGAHVIRDMAEGEEVVSPVKVAEERIGAGSTCG